MNVKAKLAILILTLSVASSLRPPICTAAGSAEVESLVLGFPSLDELEAHLGFETPRKR